MALKVSNPNILNIAGEIINLEGRANNSGRINSEQFKTIFTDDEYEITLLKKVFGIPTLRHTPQILTNEGCSLNKKEATIIHKILQARLKNLEHGTSLLHGLPLATTYQKIRNYEFLIKKVTEFTDSNKPACEPPQFKQLPKISLPHLSYSKYKPTKDTKDTNINKLLILVLILLIGVSSEKIRSQNIKDRLGQKTIEEILKSIQKNSVRIENVQNILEKVTANPTEIINTSKSNKSTPIVEPLSQITELTNDPHLRKSYETLITEFESLTENYNNLSTEYTKLEAELKGKTGAITFLQKQLESAKLKTSRESEIVANSGKTTTTKIDRTEQNTLENDIRTLTQDKLELQSQLTDIATRFSIIVKSIKNIRDNIATKKKEVDLLFEAKKVELDTEIQRKEEIIAQKIELEATLKAKNESSAAIEKEVAELREELRIRTEELVTAKTTATNTTNALELLNTNLEKHAELTTNTENSTVIAESTRLNDIIASLRKIYDKTRDPELLSQIEKLENATNTINESKSNIGQSNEFSSCLSNILLHLALIDNINDSTTPSLETPESPLEPLQDRLCIIYFFIDMLLTRIEHNIANKSIINKNITNNLHLKTMNEAEIEATKLIKSIDQLYLPNLNNSDLWPTITNIGKVIAALERNNGIIPQTTHNLLKDIANIEIAEKTKDPSKYQYILKNITIITKNILPSGNKYIDPTTYEIKTKTENNNNYSIFEITFLFLIEIRLLSRYIDYILENSPDRLECPNLSHGQVTE